MLCELPRNFKQSEVEPDMPKMGRRGDFSHFCSCRALARLRTQKQKFIHADTVLGAGSLKQTDFCVGKAQNAVNPFGLTSILTKLCEKSANEKLVRFTLTCLSRVVLDFCLPKHPNRYILKVRRNEFAALFMPIFL